MAYGDRETGLAVQHPAVIASLVSVFECFWKLGSPFLEENRASANEQALTSIRMSIIRLLADGETNEVIAKRIGISVRTCRAHISKVYEQLGARSRCQLGVLIANSGLLDLGAG
ncbi:response regulator transcription factor [Sphaerimonospora thailandensis]|uniref:HTH luxR-type domain-containing protein n=1 Tax=Sphaerimonospora thailandensis TaxID=795644 RepID=A0A8J3RAR9_9ACTN|nr:LuxR C-terminal-related transcriptional regulator [Sphaerimonospora thailandensis]GIH72581.1 hypothetical protein Mth01_48340 [Sphaerimonospora thailandensis]